MGDPRGFFVKVTNSNYQVPPKSSSSKDIAWGVNLCTLGEHKISSIWWRVNHAMKNKETTATWEPKLTDVEKQLFLCKVLRSKHLCIK